MKYPEPLLEGVLLSRYKRFFADVEYRGETLVTHCPNTGRMTGCATPGWRARFSTSNNPKRKLKWTLEQVHDGSTWIGVNPNRANALVREAIERDHIPELRAYSELKTEQRYGEGSRIDILLEGGPAAAPSCWIEVKSTTLGEGNVALFPDAVTARGAKHMRELAAMVRKGHRCVVFYCVQRVDCTVFKPADEIDPVYGQALRDAVAAGVETLAYTAAASESELVLTTPLPVEL